MTKEYKFFKKNMKLHHLGLACSDIHTSLQFLSKLYNIESYSEVIYDPEQRANLCFVTIANDTNIELVSGEAVKNIVKNGASFYHACYETNDFSGTLNYLIQQGAIQLNKASQAKLFDNRKIVFLQTDAGLIELLESDLSEEKTIVKNKILISSTFNHKLIHEHLISLVNKFDFPYEVTSIDSELLQFNLEYNTDLFNQNLMNIILIRESEFSREKDTNSINFKEFLSKITNLAKTTMVDYLLVICPSAVSSGMFKNNISEYIADYKNIYLEDLRAEPNKYFDKEIFDTYSYNEAQIPYHSNYSELLTIKLLKKLYGIYQNNYKVIVIDCDNTLWSGVCAENSIDEISLNKSNLFVQSVLLSLRERGFLLCVSSKNEVSDVKTTFHNLPGMILQEEHITIWMVNWNEKSDNLVSISDSLNIPLSSFIFIDDNPTECLSVKECLPEVFVIKHSDDYEETKEIYSNLWAFEKSNRGTKAKIRTNWYQSHFLRNEYEKTTKTLQHFLETIDLKISSSDIRHEDFERISELSYRVTQFNFSNVKYNNKELHEVISESTKYFARKFIVEDKFGEYGIVGAAICKIIDKIFYVESFFLSCRALGKYIENKIFQDLFEIAKESKCKKINILFAHTKRNAPARNFLESLELGEWQNNSSIYSLELNAQDELTFKISDCNLKESINTISKSSNEHGILSVSRIDLLSKTTILLHRSLKNKKRNYVIKKPSNDDIQKTLQNLWSNLLNNKSIDSNSDFFDLGGTSLMALRLASEISLKLYISVKLFNIFKYSVFSELLAHLFDENNKKEIVELSGFPPFIRYDYRSQSLSENQKSLWFIDSLYGNSWFYNISSVYNISGHIRIDCLIKALKDIINNNTALRSYVVYSGNEPELAINNSIDRINFESIDVEDKTEDELDNFISELQLKKFNLNEYPLYRLSLLKRRNNNYVFVIVFHHLIFDGWSKGLFNTLLSTLYSEYLQGIKRDRAATYFNYSDFVHWQKRLYTSELYRNCIEYWKKELDGLRTTILPTSTKRRNRITFEGKYQEFLVDSSLFSEIKLLEKKYTTSLFCILYSAFLLFLFKETKETDITIGYPLSGRVLPEMESIIGNFVSTLPLRINIKPEMKLKDLIVEAHKKMFSTYEHQFVPFKDLVNSISKQRENGFNPIYNIMLVLQDTKEQKLSLDNLDVEFYKRGYDAARMDFILELYSIENQLSGGVYYNTNLFNREYISYAIKSFTFFLKNISQNQNKSIRDLTSTECPKHHNIKKDINVQNFVHKEFEKNALLYPDKIALKFRNIHISYHQLNAIGNKLACFLYKIEKISQGDVIALNLKRNQDIIICILACFKLGAAYVPIDASYPTEYKKYILNDCQPKLIITNEDFAVKQNKKILSLEDIDYTILEKKGIYFPDVKTKTNDPAYIIYTSGTTGIAKGVVISHSSLANLIFELKNIYNLSASDKGILFHSFCFDFSVWEIWSILTFGGMLVIQDEPLKHDAEEIWKLIIDEKITILNHTPSVFTNMLSNTDLSSLKQKLSLRLLIFGGEAFYPDILRNWFNVFDDNMPQIYNMYGITETTVHSTYQRINKNPTDKNISIIGDAIPGVRIDVFNENNTPVGMNESGEIYVSGKGLALNYINNSLLYKQRFINISGTTWYKSGDLAKKVENGNIEYICRKDNCIKIRGYRINTKEIESVLEKHEAISKAVLWTGENTLLSLIVPSKETAKIPLNILKSVNRSGSLAQNLTTLPNGMQVFDHNRPETLLQYQEIFLDKEYIKNGIILNDGDVVIDVGANIGMFSLFVATHINNAEIYALEPVAEVFKKLNINLKTYETHAKCINAGIAQETGKNNFVYYPKVSVLSGINPSKHEVRQLVQQSIESVQTIEKSDLESIITAKTKEQTIKCTFITLSNLIEDNAIKHINLLKIDVERSELTVLHSIKEEHWKIIDQIVIEVHEFDDNLEAVFILLKKHNFNVSKSRPSILKKSNILVFYAKKNGLCSNGKTLTFNTETQWLSTKQLKKDVRDYLKTNLPNYMLPNKIYMNHNIPVTNNGKIDFNKIKEQFLSKSVNNTIVHKKDLNYLEKNLLHMWTEILDVENCDTSTNFFDLGGDSFLLLKLYYRIRNEIFANIQLVDLFTHTTIRQQVSYLKTKILER